MGALQAGIIDFVATDHSPAPPDLKQLESGDFTTAWGGIASLQLALPVLWTAAQKRGANLTDIVRWLSTNPAKLIGHQARKGQIARGFGADLLVLEPDQAFIVTADMLHHRHKVSPYIGQELRGVVTQTFLKGQQVYDYPNFTHLNQGKIITR
ncbi:amidohydrolase family protein [Hymenobacter sp. HDW8]|uniref:amidohydrolase family protein n=1 Tax=Hymenobacter sp. HDW8 TaxID=2714932 RepID=UPI0021CDED13|nr:amidohydrolase family protein [Hymenobacter sp. HDW8]